jgi:hypothetical protein
MTANLVHAILLQRIRLEVHDAWQVLLLWYARWRVHAPGIVTKVVAAPHQCAKAMLMLKVRAAACADLSAPLCACLVVCLSAHHVMASSRFHAIATAPHRLRMCAGQ